MEREARARVAVWIAIAILVATALGLRLWGFRVGLPRVFHSDFEQVLEAVELLESGSFADNSSYPVTHVYVYAAADVVDYALGRATGSWSSWRGFLKRMRADALPHEIARVYTAIAGAAGVIAVYALARQACSRRASLLAAAMVAFSPVHVIYAHQARIHVPGIAWLALAAIPTARLATRGVSSRAAAMAGLAAGALAGMYQLGYLLAAAAACIVALGARPRWRAVRPLAALAVAFAGAVLAMAALTHPPGVVRSVVGSRPFDNLLTLGIPSTAVGMHFAASFPGFVARWLASEPVVTAGAVLAVAFAVRRRIPRTLLAAYGILPAIVLAALGINYEVPRYSMSITPFAAVLAAAAFEAVNVAWLRRALFAAAVAVPLAGAIRYDALADGSDTRWRLQAALDSAPDGGPGIAVEDALFQYMTAWGGGASPFPPSPDDFYAWHDGRETPFDTLDRMGASVLIRGRVSREGPFHEFDPAARGWRLAGVIRCGALETSPLPDSPEFPFPELWLAEICGPPIEVWARDDGARSAVERAFHDSGVELSSR